MIVELRPGNSGRGGGGLVSPESVKTDRTGPVEMLLMMMMMMVVVMVMVVVVVR